MVERQELDKELIPQNLLEIDKNYHSSKRFLYLLNLAKKKYGHITLRLAGEGWKYPWQTLIVTILSAQSKDERTIEIGEDLFSKYPTLESLANAHIEDILKIYKSMNYNKTKAKHTILTAKMLLEEFNGVTPTSIEDLIKLPGVGRKTANLIISEEFNLPGICVDTHVHRICNVFGFVKTPKNNRDKTEEELKSFIPKKYWISINRLFVLWGKECPSKDKEILLEILLNKNTIYDN